MSEETLELVRSLQPLPDADLTELFAPGDDPAAAAAAAAEAASAVATEDFVCVFHGLSEDTRPGLEGLWRAWLDWLEPWDTYRVEIERLSDAGDKVLVFSRDFGRRPGINGEIELKGSAVWTVRDGKIARAEFFTDRSQALEAAGLSE